MAEADHGVQSRPAGRIHRTICTCQGGIDAVNYISIQTLAFDRFMGKFLRRTRELSQHARHSGYGQHAPGSLLLPSPQRESLSRRRREPRPRKPTLSDRFIFSPGSAFFHSPPFPLIHCRLRLRHPFSPSASPPGPPFIPHLTVNPWQPTRFLVLQALHPSPTPSSAVSSNLGHCNRLYVPSSPCHRPML
jgi:hypothetical protein